MKYNLVVAGGTAIAVALKNNQTAHTVDIKEVQSKLKQNGAVYN